MDRETSLEVAQIAGGLLHVTPQELSRLSLAQAKVWADKIKKVAASALEQHNK